MATLAMQDGNAGTNPRIGKVDDIIRLFKNAM